MMGSLMFPAIGTGEQGYPKSLVSSVMLDEILAFSQEKKPLYLRKVVIMAFPEDGYTPQVKPLKKYLSPNLCLLVVFF